RHRREPLHEVNQRDAVLLDRDPETVEEVESGGALKETRGRRRAHEVSVTAIWSIQRKTTMPSFESSMLITAPTCALTRAEGSCACASTVRIPPPSVSETRLPPWSWIGRRASSTGSTTPC